MALSERQKLEDIIPVAESDLEKAKEHLSENHFDLTCLLSEQAVEKVIKAYLNFEGVEFFPDQSLLVLFQKAARVETRFIEMETFASTFEQFRKNSPGIDTTLEEEEHKSSTRAEAENVLHFAYKIIGLVKDILKGY